MGRFVCRCCGYLTLPRQGPGTNEICGVCGWKDDLEQFQNPTRAEGANPVNLRQAQKYFEDFGVCDPTLRFEGVKPPPQTVGPAAMWALVGAVCMFLVFAAMCAGLDAFHSGLGIEQGLFIGIAIAGAIFLVVWADSRTRGPRRGVGCCRQCGYRLQGLGAKRCPECGIGF
jgi:hypothetical protein